VITEAQVAKVHQFADGPAMRRYGLRDLVVALGDLEVTCNRIMEAGDPIDLVNGGHGHIDC
jgi:hypothetical protein